MSHDRKEYDVSEIFKKDDEGKYVYNGCTYDSATDVVMGILGFCGCGQPITCLKYLERVLTHFAAKFDDEWVGDKPGEPFGSDGEKYVVCYILDSLNIMEHGGSVPGWLANPEGYLLLAAIRYALTQDDDGTKL